MFFETFFTAVVHTEPHAWSAGNLKKNDLHSQNKQMSMFKIFTIALAHHKGACCTCSFSVKKKLATYFCLLNLVT